MDLRNWKHRAILRFVVGLWLIALLGVAMLFSVATRPYDNLSPAPIGQGMEHASF